MRQLQRETLQQFKKYTTELPHDPAIPLAGIYTRDPKAQPLNRSLSASTHSSNSIHKRQEQLR
jgi:hypothetical protein